MRRYTPSRSDIIRQPSSAARAGTSGRARSILALIEGRSPPTLPSSPEGMFLDLACLAIDRFENLG
jgi:hypothetical protein